MPTGSTDISNGPPGLSVRLDVRHVPILVVGGGRVAARRVNALREAGADRVTVVATRFAENFRCDVDRITAAFDPAHLENIRLAFAATDDPAVNDHVCQSCVRRNIWCNRADRAEAGDLQMPLAWRQGTIAVTVSTGSPHLSRALAGLIRPVIAEWEDLARMSAALRSGLRGLDPAVRSAVLTSLATAEARNRAAGDGGELLRWIVDRHPQAAALLEPALDKTRASEADPPG